MASSSVDYVPLAKRRKLGDITYQISMSSVDTLPMSSFSLFRGGLRSEEIGEKISNRYNLKRVAKVLNINDLDGSSNEELAGKCVKEICIQEGWQYSFIINKEIDGVSPMSELPQLYGPSDFSPDVIIYNSEEEQERKLLSFIEVYSSPIKETEKKIIFAVADLFRFLRNTDETFSEITVFIFPNQEEMTCITSISVKWENLKFTYTLRRHETVQDGIEEIKNVLRNPINVPLMPTGVFPYLMSLTQEEMKEMCGESESSCEQVVSPHHIMVRCGRRMYKLVHDISEYHSLLDLECMFVLDPDISPPSHFVVPKGLSNQPVFMYDMVHFDPLKREDASKCLKTLVKKIKLALDELHSYGYSHNDVKLPNIAFNENYEAVLIDLDRCYPCDDIHPYFNDSKVDSCMYNWLGGKPYNGRQTDFFQLGWLVMWVLDMDHDRKWENQRADITEDPFISSLIMKGEFDSDFWKHQLLYMIK